MALPGGGSLRKWIGRQALRRGLLGSSRLWLAVFVAGRLARVLRRAAAPKRPAVVYSGRLEPGERILVRHLRRQRD